MGASRWPKASTGAHVAAVIIMSSNAMADRNMTVPFRRPSRLLCCVEFFGTAGWIKRAPDKRGGRNAQQVLRLVEKISRSAIAASVIDAGSSTVVAGGGVTAAVALKRLVALVSAPVPAVPPSTAISETT